MKSTALRLPCALLATALASGAPLLAGDVVVDGSFVSTVPTGTAPLEVTSTTRVDDLNADLLDGLDASAFARSLGNVVRVGKTGGDFTSIQAALDSITTASAANPFLVLVGPGVFTERVAMKRFVDVQGSGEGVTVISQAGTVAPDLGTVAGADDAELRFLSVFNGGGSSGAIGIYNDQVSPRLRHVTVEVAHAGPTSAYGIWSQATAGVPTEPVLSHVTVNVRGEGDVTAMLGVLNQVDANARITDVRVSVSGDTPSVKYGVFNADASPLLRDVEVSATSDDTSASVFGVVNQDSDRALLRSVRVEVTGGGTRYGVNDTRSTVEIHGLEVRVSGTSGTSYGVFDEDGTVVLERCSVEVTGGSFAFGVYKADASGALRGCTVTASGSTGTEIALQGFDSGPGGFSVDVEQSRLSGTGAAISGPAGYAYRVGASQLGGGVSGSATYTCAYAYDGSFGELTSACVPPAP